MTSTVVAAPARVATRIASVDVLRGVVMVLMAIDHVRVYSGVPAGGPTAGLFLTRWVTHFCAPLFVFFAGTSAWLLGRRLPRAELARYLVSRGALLILLEPTLIRASWTFGLDYSQFLLAGVIWMLGVCLVLMAALIWLPLRAIAIAGFLIVLGQDVFRLLPPGWFTQFVYAGGTIPFGDGGPTINVLYSIVPWIGVMALGYAFGSVLLRDPVSRDRWCLRVGLSMTVLFLIAAGIAVAMNPNARMPVWMQVLNQRKYPASQLFLLMTLGPAIALVPYAERARDAIARLFEVFGRVPMFYYLLHIPVIHALSLLVWYLRDGTTHAANFMTAPYVSMPVRWPLWLLYAVFVAAVAILYEPCRWFASLKARRTDAWLRYI